MFKKLTLLAMAVALVAAFAVPASAFAGTHWTHEGATVEGFEEDFTGFAKFEVTAAPGNNFGCTVHVHLNANQNGTTAEGTITSFEVTTATCVGEGAFAGCELETDSSNTPWGVDATNTDLVISNGATGIVIQNKYKEAGGCLVPGSIVTFPSITATPTPNIAEVECLDLSGSGTGAKGEGVSATGELCAYHPGTYGWEVI